MAKVTVEANCPGCTHKTKITIKKPGQCDATVVSFVCSGCESKLLARIAKPSKIDTKNPSLVQIGVKITHPSPLLIAMNKEEAEHNMENA